jgi:hypothetical protein
MWDRHSKTEYIDTVKSTAESIAENHDSKPNKHVISKSSGGAMIQQATLQEIT